MRDKQQLADELNKDGNNRSTAGGSLDFNWNYQCSH